MKKFFMLPLCAIIVFSAFAGCSSQQPEPEVTSEPTLVPETESLDDSIKAIMAEMTLEDKAGQMVQAALYAVQPSDVGEYGLGSVLSGGGNSVGRGTQKDWVDLIESFQEYALSRDVPIPIIYGLDAVHGNVLIKDPIIFPHNIGLGAANDPELMGKMGEIIAQEMRYAGVHWNFGPCVALAMDPRWGRTYESMSTDIEIISSLSSAYTKGMQEYDIIACAKHYMGDGGTEYGTGQMAPLDRGDVVMTDEEFENTFLAPYEQLVNDGVYTVMVSFSSINGVKMHENKHYITDVLKGELGFQGLVISDWEGHQLIESARYNDKVAKAINAGIDMLMEPEDWKMAIEAIVDETNKGNIPMERIDDAVYRILWVKFQIGLFDNPLPSTDYEVRTDENIAVAQELVEKSCVLLKNENGLLPIKEGTKVFITGPVTDDIGAQCGGWTKSWQGSIGKVTHGTTLLEGLDFLKEEKNIEIITDINRIGEADMMIIAIGEIPYAEWEGDSEDMSITGRLALAKNIDAIETAKNAGLPVVAVIFAGRNVMITDYIDDWDSVVMAYLPGTEGQGIANLLLGDAQFSGKLSMPWYKTVEDIKKENPELLFDFGYGLTY
ncbi:MAG: glycoside hydrolase family 3 protein [Eubacteriales bacterium]